MQKNIPTESDWRSIAWCLDMPFAYDHFFGKALGEAVSMFEENAIGYSEDMMTMPTSCLSYYIDAYISYLQSSKSRGDSDAAACFFGLIEARHDDIRTFKFETLQLVQAVLCKLGTQQEWYDADPEIYGDFAMKSRQAIGQLMGNT